MAEINLGAMAKNLESLESQVEIIKGQIGEVGDKPIGDVLEQFGGFIVHTNRQLNGFVNTTTGEIEEAGILARLTAVETALVSKQQKGQPDWFLNRDPEEAAKWLEGIAGYVDRVLQYIPTQVAPLNLAPCWPWHPRIVAELLASMCHYLAVYKGGPPNAVSEMWRVHLDGAIGRVGKHMGGCDKDWHKVTMDNPATGSPCDEWKVDLEAVPAYIAWWCGDRKGIPPGLSPTP